MFDMMIQLGGEPIKPDRNKQGIPWGTKSVLEKSEEIGSFLERPSASPSTTQRRAAARYVSAGASR